MATDLETLGKRIAEKLSEATKLEGEEKEFAAKSEDAKKRRNAVLIAAGTDLIEAHKAIKALRVNVSFEKWCKEIAEISKARAYELMKLAGAEDPEKELEEQRTKGAERKRASREKKSSVTSQPVTDGKPAAPAVPASPVGEIVPFKPAAPAAKKPPTEFEKAEVALAHNFRQLGEDEFAELLVAGLEMIAGRPSFDKVIDWGVEFRQIQKDKTHGKV